MVWSNPATGPGVQVLEFSFTDNGFDRNRNNDKHRVYITRPSAPMTNGPVNHFNAPGQIKANTATAMVHTG